MEDSFMLEAIELAVENVRTGRGGPFAALVVKDGEVVARGANLVTTSNDPTAHAEVVAIRAACRSLESFQLDGCDLYTTCEPCPMCMGAIYWARLRRVFYAGTREDAAAAGFDDQFIYEEIAKAPGERHIEMTPLLRDASQRAFDAWNEQEGRIEY
jgi:guanine deaminase